MSLVVGLSALCMTVLSLAAAAVFFSGFIESDPVGIQLLQAFLLAFGVAALMAVPFGFIAWWALKARTRRPFLTLLLMLPWVAIGVIWVVFAPFDWFIGVVPAAVALLAILRAFLPPRSGRT